MRLARVKVQTEYTALGGGLDQVTPPLSIKPGRMINGVNYEVGTNGGYRRIDGYERFDGQPSPSDATYYNAQVTLVGTVEVGDSLEGNISGATGVVSNITEGALNLTKVDGTFEEEAILKDGLVVGQIANVPDVRGELTALADAVALNAAADQYRADISAPPGSGPIRGLALLKGDLYCFQDNAGGTAGNIYKATGAGWLLIPLYYEMSFDTGVASIPDGTAITQVTSGATATVERTVLESGAWGTDAAGRLILSGISGTFNDSDAIQVGGVTAMTATSVPTQISISPGGRYETFVYNFYGSLDTKRIYGADGVNRGFEFDGEVYVPINTSMEADIPEYVYAHKLQLFFSFKGSLQNSGVGNPYKWTAIAGANAIDMGDDITGLISLPGKALAVMSRNESSQLLGDNIDDFDLDGISDEVGCIPRTVQRLGYSYCLDDRGIIVIYPTEKFGNFEQNTISRSVQPAIDKIRGNVVASAVYRSRNQYRLYCSDGTGIIMTLLENNAVGFSLFEYPVNVACTVAGEDANGKDVVFFGDDQGMVYQADKGTSFDGEEIEAYVYLPFNHSKSPSVLKTYRKATIEMTAAGYAEILISPDFSYGDPELETHGAESATMQGAGGYWDIDEWGSFFYDSATVSTPPVRIEGTGSNIGFILYSKSEIDAGHKLDGLLIHYTPRRLVR